MKKISIVHIGILIILLIIPLSLRFLRFNYLQTPTENKLQEFAEDCESKEEDFVKTFCWMTQAKNELDTSICKKIPSTDKNFTMCLANVGVAKEDPSVCNETSEKDRCYFILGEALHDVSICRRITQEEIQNECIAQAQGVTE